MFQKFQENFKSVARQIEWCFEGVLRLFQVEKNRFFDPSTPFMKKGDDGEEKKDGKTTQKTINFNQTTQFLREYWQKNSNYVQSNPFYAGYQINIIPHGSSNDENSKVQNYFNI